MCLNKTINGMFVTDQLGGDLDVAFLQVSILLLQKLLGELIIYSLLCYTYG